MKVETVDDVDPNAPVMVEKAIQLTLRLPEASKLTDAIERAAEVLDDEGCQDDDKERVRRLEQLAVTLRHEIDRLIRPLPNRAPEDRPTQPGPPSYPQAAVSASSPAPELPALLDVVASHVLPQNREFTVRVYRCDHMDGRDPNETLARVFDDEAKARLFYTKTQSIWNMRVRGGEAPAYDVVLGVQDKRKHAKKKSYRELMHALCNGGPA